MISLDLMKSSEVRIAGDRPIYQGFYYNRGLLYQDLLYQVSGVYKSKSKFIFWITSFIISISILVFTIFHNCCCCFPLHKYTYCQYQNCSEIVVLLFYTCSISAICFNISRFLTRWDVMKNNLFFSCVYYVFSNFSCII